MQDADARAPEAHPAGGQCRTMGGCRAFVWCGVPSDAQLQRQAAPDAAAAQGAASDLAGRCIG